jgi:hypothetical protein
VAQHDRTNGTPLTWRKSSRSGLGGSGNGSGSCVEIAFDATGPLVRDSKQGSRSPILAVSPTQFAALLNTIKH